MGEGGVFFTISLHVQPGTLDTVDTKLVPPLPAWGHRCYGPHAFPFLSRALYSPECGAFSLDRLTEQPVWATLSPVRDNYEPDAAVRIRVTQDLEQVPLPPLDLANPSPRGFWRQRGTLSVTGPWLVAKVGEGPGPVESLQRPLSVAFRQVRGLLKFIDFSITRDHKAELAGLLTPHQLLRLTPGRCPAGVRATPPDNYEIWIPLGDTDAR